MSQALIDEVCTIPSSTSLFNPYRDDNEDDLPPGAQGRIQRLRAYLSGRQGGLLLIGEAPGYAGARISGIAFTSEQMILDGRVPGVVWNDRMSRRASPWKEMSCSIVYKTMDRLGLASQVTLWNALPLHPRAGEPTSNRTPTSAEIRLGAPALKAMIGIVQPIAVVAVGQKAKFSLDALGVTSILVRHPANGGATAFARGIESAATKAGLLGGQASTASCS